MILVSDFSSVDIIPLFIIVLCWVRDRNVYACSWERRATKWCGFEVQKASLDWSRAEGTPGTGYNQDLLVSVALQDTQIIVVDEEHKLQPALHSLQKSMKDVIGIDLEWKPDNAQEENNVALMQLASQTVVLLIRTCKIGVPKKLINFLRENRVVGVGFDWDSNDERKLQKAYQLGRSDLFHHFIDVKKQAEVLGYYDFGVASLSLQLLDFEPPRPITTSDWEAPQLSQRQTNYAAMDALITADMFRQLRVLHQDPDYCDGCTTFIGEWNGPLDLKCPHSDCARRRPFRDAVSVLRHAKKHGHTASIFKCEDCQRIVNFDYEAQDNFLRFLRSDKEDGYAYPWG